MTSSSRSGLPMEYAQLRDKITDLVGNGVSNKVWRVGDQVWNNVCHKVKMRVVSTLKADFK
jgi:hypothetical protein